MAVATADLIRNATDVIVKYESSDKELAKNLEKSSSEFQKYFDSMYLEFSTGINLITKREDERDGIKRNFERKIQEEHAKLNEQKTELIQLSSTDQKSFGNEVEENKAYKREEMKGYKH